MEQKNFDTTGLTEDQQKAIANLTAKQEGRFFIGTSPEIMIENFRRINILRATDVDFAEECEKRYFQSCDFDPTK